MLGLVSLSQQLLQAGVGILANTPPHPMCPQGVTHSHSRYPLQGKHDKPEYLPSLMPPGSLF